ncbi:hypothetical protein [Natrinema soli]|uniref:Uncharacterized protein n=1 Tax=Natrinema soli TaxID=1930624 RepID=A0ABD5SUX3_9EURY|nr:hypothetical protein [Natrinema soli]
MARDAGADRYAEQETDDGTGRRFDTTTDTPDRIGDDASDRPAGLSL